MITRLGDLAGEVEARLDSMPAPPGSPVNLADLTAARDAINQAEDNDPDANRAIPVPGHIAEPILGLLASRGDTGARRDEIVVAIGRPESSVKRWLRILRDHELITAQGATSAARYYLPGHAPDADADTDTSAEGDDAA